MSAGVPGDRRAGGSPPPTARRGPAAAVRDAVVHGLFRLPAGEARVARGVRHVRHGVLLSELVAVAVLVHALVTDTPGRRHPLLLGMAALVVVGVPLLLLLPLPRLVRDRRGPALFYLWSAAATAGIVVAIRLDGGPASPLDALLLLTLAAAAVGCPPWGVAAVGTVMTGSHALLVALPGGTASGAFTAVVLGAATVSCALASAASWAARDRQALLLETQATLASTDPLTGVPNRRTFLERAGRAVDAAGWGHRAVVCVVALDGAGRAADDALLRAVAAVLGGVVRETDTVARLGGAEFAVLADVTAVSSGDVLAERLRRAVALVGERAGVTASVGVTDVQPGDDVAELLQRAEVAVRRASTAGGDRVDALDG